MVFWNKILDSKNKNDEESVIYDVVTEKASDEVEKSTKITKSDTKSKARSEAVDIILSTSTAQVILGDYVDGGKYTNQVTIEFSYENESFIPRNERRGGATDFYFLSNNNEWKYWGQLTSPNEMTKDTKFKIVIWVNHAHVSIGGSAATYVHEISVHAVLFLRIILPKLLNEGTNEFFLELSRANAGSAPGTKLDVQRFGYFTEYGSHLIYGLGLNPYYTSLCKEVSSKLSGKDKQNFDYTIQSDIARAKSDIKNVQLGQELFIEPTSFDF